MNYIKSTTKEHLLKTAVDLIRSIRHPNEFTIRRLIMAAGVNLNAVNYHFGSKVVLIREAVRIIITQYFQERNIQPGSTGTDLLKNLIRICDFLFYEPVAARLALESELEEEGSGNNLTTETMHSLTSIVRSQFPELNESEVMFRIWCLIAIIHQFVLRPSGSDEWMGKDPRNKSVRDYLLAQICTVLGLPCCNGDESITTGST